MRMIPSAFAQHIAVVFGEAGISWIERLPALVEQCEQRWSLTVGDPYTLSYNYVAPATRHDGTPVVLKVGVPHPELRTEIEALRLYQGHGIVQLLEADVEQGAFVIERLTPGTPLIELHDDEAATAIAAEVMHKLWRPAPAEHTLATVEQWAQGLARLRPLFDGGTGPFPKTLVDYAEGLFAELLPSQDTPMLLHGDLHHWNIARAQREPWLALDPKGLVGEAAYEIGAWMRNPMPHLTTWPDLRRSLDRRLDQFHDRLGLDRERMRGWSIAQAVLSAWWFFEDEGSVEPSGLITAEALMD